MYDILYTTEGFEVGKQGDEPKRRQCRRTMMGTTALTPLDIWEKGGII